MNPASNRAPTKTVEQPITPHSRTAKILHWGFILVFAYGLAKQLDDVEELEDFGLLQNDFCLGLSHRFARQVRLHARHATNCVTQQHGQECPAYQALGPCRASGDVRKYGADCRFGIVHWWAVLDRHKNWIGYGYRVNRA